MGRYVSILFLLLMFLSAGAFETKDIMVRNISTEQGLSHHSVNAIWQDEFGFIWIGTLDGLNRYDGRHFKVFKPEADNPYSITENNIRQVCGDGDGHLYIRGLSSLSEFDMRTQRFKMLSDKIKGICVSSGCLWVSYTDVISVYDRAGGQFIEKFRFSDKNMSDVVIDGFAVGKNGLIYTWTVSDGLFVINENGNIIRHLNVENVRSVLEDSKGNVWIATSSDGVRVLMTDGQTLQYSYTAGDDEGTFNNVRSVCEDKNGDMWMSTYGGLVKLDTHTGQMTHCRYESEHEAFNVLSITPMFYDRQGTLWFGSFHNGVSYYNPDAEKYNIYRATPGAEGRLNASIVSAFEEDENGRVFVGTEGGWVNVLDRKTGKFKLLPVSQTSHDMLTKSLLYDKDEKILYVATLFNGIVCIDMSEDAGAVLAESGNTGQIGNVVSMVECGDSLLLGTNHGIRVFDKRTRVISDMETGFRSHYHKQVWDIVLDDDEKVWFTTSSDLYCYDMKNNMTRCYVFGDIVSNAVNNHFNHILKDSKGRLWFGSSGSGFFLYEAETDSFRRFSQADGMPSGFVTEIDEDTTSGLIYVATNKGLVSYDAENDILRSHEISDNFQTESIRNMFITSDGEMFIADLEGMRSVRCRNLDNQPRNYGVFVSGLMVDNVPSQPGGGSESSVSKEDILYQREIHLSPDHSSISFEITCTDYLNVSERVVEYKLEGFDDGFITTSCQHPITYTNLSPGQYTFIVRGLHPDKQGKYPQFEMVVHVAKPFYLTWWFILLVVLLVAAIVFYLFRVYAMSLKLKSLNSTNESKTRFFTNISHEFRTPLTLINGQLEVLLQDDRLKPSVYSKILSIYKGAVTMNGLVNEIVDVMKSESGKMRLRVAEYDIVGFLREIYVTFEEYARQRNIELTFTSPKEQDIVLKYDKRQMEKVFFNILSNAFKYTPPGGSVNIEVVRTKDGAAVRISDSGSGIEQQHLEHIFEMFYQDDNLNASQPNQGSGIGLSLTKALVEMHDGSVSVASKIGEGTCFTVQLKEDPKFSGEVILAEDIVLTGTVDSMKEYEDSGASNEGERTYNGYAQKMLVVEDSEEIRAMLESIFSPIYHVLTASCAEEGLSLARKESPDIIVSDVMMPGMSGIEMCRIIKDNIETCHIPVVLLTAYALENYVVEGYSTGADDYVTKPFNVKILVARCDNLIKSRRRLQEKYMNQPEASVSMLSNNSKDQTLLEKAVSIVLDNIDDPEFKIDVFAHELGLSRTYLFSKIKALTGQSPNEFISTIRLKEAASRLIVSREDSISEIAYSLGFSSSSYFINCFKSRYGKTPAQYRKEYLQ